MTEQPSAPQVPEDAIPVAPPTLPYTLHASLSQYRRGVGVVPVILALIISIAAGVRLGPLGVVIFPLGMVVLIGGILLFLGKRTVTMTSDAIEYRLPIGAPRRLALSEVEGVKVFLTFVEGVLSPVPRVSIAQKGLKKPITLTGRYWPLEELEKLLAAMSDKKIRVEYYADPANSAMIAEQLPTYASLIERHPWWIAWGVVFGIVIVVTIFVLIFM